MRSRQAPESKSPHFVKPAHTVWHNGTESQTHVIVVLVDDQPVHEETPPNPSLPEETPPNPSLPEGRRLTSSTNSHQVRISIAGLQLSAKPLFPTHRRRKLQATNAPADLLHLFFEFEAADGNGTALCDQLNADPAVLLAYLAPISPSLPTAAASSDSGTRRLSTHQIIKTALASAEERRRSLQSPSYVHLQGYRGPSPTGFDFDEAAEYPGGDGAGITVADIEGGANLDHEDLGMEEAQMINSLSTMPDWIAHGTAVWGEIKGEYDSEGVRGGAVAVTPLVANVFDARGRFISLATVLADTADQLQPGDVMLIEQHYSHHGDGATYAPVEYYAAEWAAIRAAVDRGIVVVEAGANGRMDLDAVQDGRFQRGHANFADSGAIMVGGARHKQRTWIGSSYGSRIDVQGWYDWSVATTGYGGLQGSLGDNDAYTGSFAGTSSASPMVTAAAAVMQSVARTSMGRVLEPDELRQLMVRTGTPQPADGQGGAATNPIGPQPDLRRALAALSNARAQHGGCCQRSHADSRVAPWEYHNGVPIALASRTIGCNRGAWMPFKTYSPAMETCEDLRSFEVISGSTCTVHNQCVYSNAHTSRYTNHESCAVRQRSAFPLQVRSFDVERHSTCRYDSLTVNGQAYCGAGASDGPQGVTPAADSNLVWNTDYSATRGGFKLCPPSNMISTATLSGRTYASCEGTYAKSTDMLNGKAIWDRTTGSRFIFWCNDRWRITGSQWRQGFLDGSTRHCGAFISSANAAEHWFDASWSNNQGDVAAAP